LKVTWRSGLLLTIVLAAAAMLFVRLWKMGTPHAALPADAPSVLFITLDTLRADRLSAYGSASKLTPGLDRLAEEGVVFEQAFCVMPTTLPSHAAMLFGTWPGVLGTTNNTTRITNTSIEYLPETLLKAGYRTAAFLSTHHLGASLERFGGFEVFDFPPEQRTADETLALVRRWLRENGSRPFFLWVHLWDPHWPYVPHPRFLPELPRALNDLPRKRHEFFQPGAYTREQARGMVELYDNEVAFLDFHLGRFLDETRERPEWFRLMTMVTSDHGETLDELIETEGYGFDHGEYLYDHQIRVPLIVVPPRGMGTAGRVAEPVSHVDLMPTILEALGLPGSQTAAGESFLPLLAQGGHRKREASVFFQRRTFREPPRPFLAKHRFGVRSSEFKLFYDLEDGRTELFRSGDDNREIGDEEPKVRDRLRAQLRQWIETSGSATSYRTEPVSEQEIEKLRALGYVQ
jgi:arylsulfatase A-like enzyme